MRKFFLYPLISLIALVLFVLLSLVAILFFRPTLIINPKNIDHVLKFTNVFKSYSWTDADITHHWLKWNERRIKGHFKDLCLNFENDSFEYKGCLSEVSWDFKLSFLNGRGVKSEALSPILVRGKRVSFVIKDGHEKEESTSPPIFWSYWNLLWNPVIPDLDLKIDNNEFSFSQKKIVFDLSVVKTLHTLDIYSMGFHLYANPQKMILKAPAQYPLPKKIKLLSQSYLRDMTFTADIRKEGIPLNLAGSLDDIAFGLDSYIKLPLKESLSSIKFRKNVLLTTKGFVSVSNVKKMIGRFAPAPFNILPAPLNEMDGSIRVDINQEKGEQENSVVSNIKTALDLKGKKQSLIMDLKAGIELSLETFSPISISVGVDFKKVQLRLPRISQKELPPQFLPDSRIQNTFQKPRTKVATVSKSNLQMSFQLDAIGEKALQLNSNLLDEILKVNFQLLVEEGALKKGYVKTLPLRTKVFKRQLLIPSIQIDFHAPTEPVLNGVVKFLLPQYEVTMNLEGPISEPRFSFTSEPPLERNDIYAVLLFGRTLADLDPDDKRATGKTNELFASGILSLSVLYFLSGSPIEYIGYDPDSKSTTAQIGLGSKSSLRIGGDSSGLNSTGIRHSIGKGWYIDTSAQEYKGAVGNNSATDYGVMLERIIAY